MTDGAPVPTEHEEQAALIGWLLNYAIREEPLIHPLVFAVSNGAMLKGDKRMRMIQINRLKAEGFTPGVSDILCLIPRNGFHYMAIEMKKRDRENEKKAGVLTGGVEENQREFLNAVRQAGGFDTVCYGADDAIDMFRWYLGIKGA